MCCFRVDAAKIELVGHSLGAHLAGAAGRQFTASSKKRGGKRGKKGVQIGIITGEVLSAVMVWDCNALLQAWTQLDPNGFYRTTSFQKKGSAPNLPTS